MTRSGRVHDPLDLSTINSSAALDQCLRHGFDGIPSPQQNRQSSVHKALHVEGPERAQVVQHAGGVRQVGIKMTTLLRERST